jgi:hypothetical protein
MFNSQNVIFTADRSHAIPSPMMNTKAIAVMRTMKPKLQPQKAFLKMSWLENLER